MTPTPLSLHRHQFLSAAALRVLRSLRTETDPDADVTTNCLTHTGRGWWVGTKRISPHVADELLRLCLVKDVDDHVDERCRHYCKTTEGARVETDPGYMPRILRCLNGEDVTQESP